MLADNLKLLILKEHARDKKLTYIAYSLLAFIVLAAAIFIGGWLLKAMDPEGTMPAYPKIMLGVALLGYIGYSVWKIIKLNKREQQIDDLFTHLASGARALDIIESKEYKITVPLGKVTYRMYPVEFFKFALDNAPMRYYSLPVHPSFGTDFKTLLSGANLGKINEAIADIYAPNDARNAAKAVEAPNERAGDPSAPAYDDNAPIRSVEEYREYLKAELSDDIAKIEKSREDSQKMKKVGMIAAIVVVLAFVGYMIYQFSSGPMVDEQGNSTFSVTGIIIFMAVLFGGYFAYYFLVMKPKMMANSNPADLGPGGVAMTPQFSFKTKLLEKIISFASPGAQYVMHGHVSEEEFLASGIFSTGLKYKLTGNDLIIGRHHGVPFQFCDLNAEIQKRVTRENDGPEYAFIGQFFVARFNKSFSSEVRVYPRTSLFKSGISQYTQTHGEKIELEDPEFMKLFKVYGTDQVEARYILTTSMMERLKELATRIKGDEFYVSFVGNRITVANNSSRNNFEITGKRSITADDNKMLVDFYNELVNQFAIIDDLKLNIKIWK